MSLQTPTTKQINDNIIAQLEASLSQTIPLLPKSFLRVLSKSLSGVFILLYKYAGFMFLQQFVRTASIDPTEVNGQIVRPLIEWGRLVGVGDPVAATQAELLVDVTVTNQTGFIPSGSQLIGAGNGVTYITIGSTTLDAPVVQATILAASDQSNGGGAGIIGNLDPGALVSFANPLANIEQSAVVDSQVTTGANAEATEVYRQRVVDKFQKRPQGGAYSDYEQWGEQVAGVVNVYPYTSEFPGQVAVYVEATPASSGSADGIPTSAQLQAVLDSIELDENGLASRRPAGALVNAFPIDRVEFQVVVDGLDVPEPAAVQALITTALQEYFLSREPYIFGLSVPPRSDRISQGQVAGVVSDIVGASGGVFNTVTVSTGTLPVTIFSLGIGKKAKLGSVFFL